MRTSTFDIPAQPLLQALTAFGRQSGLQVTVDSDTGAGKTNAAVSGTMTADEALRRLLAGTGLTYQFTSADAVTIAGPPASPAGSAAVQLDPVRVGAASPPPQAEIGNLPPAYAGDDVARGGKVGLLGVRDFMDMPLSETTYTEQHIQNQQARTLTDVLAADPTVRSGWPNGNVFDDRLMIRGVLVLNPNYGLGGLYGIVPNESIRPVSSGSKCSAGPPPSSTARSPKRSAAPSTSYPSGRPTPPIAQAAALYSSDSQLGGSFDFGRRFWPGKSIGLRANGSYISGNTSVNSQSAERLALTVGLDYRSGDTRMDADLGFPRRVVQKFQGGMFLGTGVQLPPAPNARNSSYQPWERLQGNDLYGLSIGSPPLTSDSVYSSFGLVDSISFAGDMFQLIGGARAQQLQTANYSTTTGLPTNGNNQTVISPSAALVFKPRQELMLYTNYIQALQQGPIAGAGLTNAGQQFPPFVSTQYEVGAKVDLGTFGMTLSAFQITIPSSYTDVSTNCLVTTASSATKVSSSWPSASRSKG